MLLGQTIYLFEYHRCLKTPIRHLFLVNYSCLESWQHHRSLSYQYTIKSRLAFSKKHLISTIFIYHFYKKKYLSHRLLNSVMMFVYRYSQVEVAIVFYISIPGNSIFRSLSLFIDVIFQSHEKMATLRRPILSPR